MQKSRGLGTITVHIRTARGVEIVPLEDIREFREGQRLINETAHAARLAIQRAERTQVFEGTHPLAAGARAGEAKPDYVQQLLDLASLRDAGVLSAEEFEAKKAQILARM